MTADNVIYGVDFKARMGAAPETIEAIMTAAAMSGGGKCAMPTCDRGSSGCSYDGCLLNGYTAPDGDCA